jgi:hypothetical protein
MIGTAAVLLSDGRCARRKDIFNNTKSFSPRSPRETQIETFARSIAPHISLFFRINQLAMQFILQRGMNKTARHLFALLLFLSTTATEAFSQNPDSSKYLVVEYMRSKTGDYISLETKIWKPIHQQLINEGKKSAWYLYKVKYPGGATAPYDYVVVDVYPEWNFLETPFSDVAPALKKVNPKLSMDSLIKKTERSRDMAWKQLFRLMGQAVAKEAKPSKYIVSNEVKTVPGGENEYVKLEQTWFKPFHAARAVLGIMNNWGLYKRELPYGEKYPYDYVTLNGYLTWADITKQNPPDAWRKVHGDTNFNEVHEKILSKRITVNVEVWELVDYAVKTK